MRTRTAGSNVVGRARDWVALSGSLALLACAETPEPPPIAPAPARPVAVAEQPPTDDVSCARRREHDRACSSASPSSTANAEILGKVCMSERACLESVWTKSAVDRYMGCRVGSACGTDCQREITKTTPPGETLGTALAQCQKVCAGGDGASICDSVLGKFAPWKPTAQAAVAQCFATTTDCFEALSCARTGASGPAAELGGCLGKAVARACLDGAEAPMCREMHELLKPKKP